MVAVLILSAWFENEWMYMLEWVVFLYIENCGKLEELRVLSASKKAMLLLISSSNVELMDGTKLFNCAKKLSIDMQR